MGHPQAEALAQAFISNFWAADHSIRWIRTEFEASTMLDQHTMLVGRVDAIGINDMGKRFFGEWKTASAWQAKNMPQVKAQWRFRPQALTYGVLLDSVFPGIRDFTTRWAIKTNPVTTDFEWYTYTTEELEWWKQEVRMAAVEIRRLRNLKLGREGVVNWPVNPDNCFRYGAKYVCPFFYPCCSQLKFVDKPPDSIVRISHLETERNLKVEDEHLVVLDATRIGTWINCRERYRREYEDNIVADPSEALVVGQEFHDIYGNHLAKLVKE